MGLLLTDTAKPNADGSTTRDKGGGGPRGGSKVMGSLAPLFNDTKWDVGEGKADTPEDSSHRQKKLLSCVGGTGCHRSHHQKELSSCVDGTGCHSFGD